MAHHQSSHAKAINIIYFDEETGSFKLDDLALSSILDRSDIKNFPVVLVSVCGAFRRGKSFLMSIMLKYLQFKKNNPTSDFSLKDDDILSGFEFKSGSKRTTSGVTMWNEPFIMRKDNGQKVALLLMDTQGLFDSDTSIRECSSIFALTTLTSSKIIYNIHHQIQEDDLNNLLFFAEYGKFLCAETGSKPFHDIIFMVRDWQWIKEYDYGVNSEYLTNVLDESKVKKDDMKQTRNLIKSLFDNQIAILLPHPGLNVISSIDHECQAKILDNAFKDHIADVCKYIFDPKNLNILNINNSEVTASQLMTYMSKYMMLFSSSELPEPRNLYLVTAEANNIFAMNDAKAHYTNSIDDICSADKPYMKPKILKFSHDLIKKESINKFKSIKKMGDAAFCRSYQEKLEKDIDEQFEKLLLFNDSKKTFSISSFVLKVLFFCLIFNIIANFMRLIGLKPISSLLLKITYSMLLMMIVSSSLKYTNLYLDSLEFLDMFENAIEMLFNYLVTLGLALSSQPMQSGVLYEQQRRQSTSKAD